MSYLLQEQYTLNGKPTRSVVLWPQTNPKGNDDTFANEEIPEMRLYLDCVNQKFNFDDIQIFSRFGMSISYSCYYIFPKYLCNCTKIG